MQFTRAYFYTILDIWNTYNILCIAPRQEKRTAFLSKEGLHEPLVMPFGLTNVPATFQNFIHDMLALFLDRFVMASLDTILIYLYNPTQYWKHVRKVLKELRKAGLHFNTEKCKFHEMEVTYLSLIIQNEELRMDTEMMAAVIDLPIPRSVFNFRSFLRFSNF